jgi:hypothetical protein
MESAFSSRNLQKDHCATFVRTDGVLLEVRNQKEECCAWNLVAIISHILSLTLTASLRLMVRSLSLFVSNPCLTFLSSDCTSSILNPVYSWIRVYHRAIPWRISNLLPFFLLYWCSCITYFEGVLYMASVHSQAVWSWSQPCAYISFVS